MQGPPTWVEVCVVVVVVIVVGLGYGGMQRNGVSLSTSTQPNQPVVPLQELDMYPY